MAIGGLDAYLCGVYRSVYGLVMSEKMDRMLETYSAHHSSSTGVGILAIGGGGEEEEEKRRKKEKRKPKR